MIIRFWHPFWGVNRHIKGFSRISGQIGFFDASRISGWHFHVQRCGKWRYLNTVPGVWSAAVCRALNSYCTGCLKATFLSGETSTPHKLVKKNIFQKSKPVTWKRTLVSTKLPAYFFQKCFFWPTYAGSNIGWELPPMRLRRQKKCFEKKKKKGGLFATWNRNKWLPPPAGRVSGKKKKKEIPMRRLSL